MLSWELNHISLPCLIVSPIIIVISILASGYFLRVVSNNVIIGTFRSCFLDFVTAGEATLISWELLSLFHQYGIWVWGVGAWVTITVKTYRYRADTTACPYTHLLNLMAGLTDLRTVAARVAAQFTGGLVSYRLLCSVWNIGLTPLHVYRSYWTSYGVCYAWLAVSTWEGFCLEFSGSLVCGVFAAIIFDWEIFTQLSIHKRILLSSSVTTALVLVSFHRTGGFFQPLLAFVRTFGCIGAMQEVTGLDHIMVYWVGATLGAVSATYLAKFVKNIIMKMKKGRRHKTREISEDPLLESVNIY